VTPGPLIASALSLIPPEQRPRFVVAAGKAAAGMLRAALPLIDFDRAVLASHEDAAFDDRRIAVFLAGHPSANAESVRAAEHALALAAESRSRGGLLVLLSGGASAMLAAPVEGVDLEDKQETARLLMRAGAAIDELNCVRKHLSRIKGGRLAAAARTTTTLALSDVHAPVADDPSVIGSGPTVSDPTTFADAAAIVEKYRVLLPASVRQHLAAGLRGAADETVKAGDPRIESSSYAIVGNRQTAVEAARRAAMEAGYGVVVVDQVIAGEASRAGESFATAALAAVSGRDRPLCVLGSGETTVTVRGGGSGGRNQEFALGSLAVLEARRGQRVVIGSAGTDGVDGPTSAAGALVDATTAERARAAGVSPSAALEQNDAFPFFAALQDLIVWGPTGTNVGDLHIVLVG
jgi:glycerate-2-kinase